MTKSRPGPHMLLLSGVCLCLLYVWLPAYFITGDGPGHVYNAQVVHDLWAGKNVAFYSRFYDLAYRPNPNWLSTLAIAALMFVVNGVIAEKIFLTLYVALYVSGFYLLLKRTGGGTSYLVLVILVFIFPQTLAKGFYNFSFSIAFYFWMVWSWLCFLEKKSLRNALLFLLFTTLCFFTHLLAFGFAAFTCTVLVASYAIAKLQNGVAQKKAGFFIKYSLFLILFLSPFLALMRWFTEQEGGLQMQLKPHLYRLVELVEGKYLVNVTHGEDFIAELAGIIMLVLLCFSFFRTKRKIVIHKYDGFLLTLFFVLFVYLCFPESFLGHLILISMRAQVYVFLLMVFCISYRFPVGEVKMSDALVVLLVLLVFSVADAMTLAHAAPGVLAGNYSVRQVILTGIALQLGVILLILFCVVRKVSFDSMKTGGLVLLYLCFIIFAGLRLFVLMKASSAVSDYTSAKSIIRPNSIVLPLDFAPCGKDEQGKIISDRNFLFYHASQYMGLEKPMIILDNYEANMGYFPLRWKDSVNPYYHLSKDEGIEAQPPYASIEEFKKTTGVSIDYVLLWCFDSSYLSNEHFNKLYTEINAGYHKVYTSPTGRTTLFERNPENTVQ